jgi:hypothetical protein
MRLKVLVIVLLAGLSLVASQGKALVVNLNSSVKDGLPVLGVQSDELNIKNNIYEDPKENPTLEDLGQYLSFIETIIEKFYGKPLEDLGEAGKRLKEILALPENAENIKIEEVEKNGMTIAKISYVVKNEDGIKIQNEITFESIKTVKIEGGTTKEYIKPLKLTFKQTPLNGGMIGGGTIEEFLFTPKGIEYSQIS